jgi:hypothetical protein
LGLSLRQLQAIGAIAHSNGAAGHGHGYGIETAELFIDRPSNPSIAYKRRWVGTPARGRRLVWSRLQTIRKRPRALEIAGSNPADPITFEGERERLHALLRQVICPHMIQWGKASEFVEKNSDAARASTREGTTRLGSLSQDSNLTERAREHSQKNWEAMLEGLKNLLETRSRM